MNDWWKILNICNRYDEIRLFMIRLLFWLRLTVWDIGCYSSMDCCKMTAKRATRTQCTRIIFFLNNRGSSERNKKAQRIHIPYNTFVNTTIDLIYLLLYICRAWNDAYTWIIIYVALWILISTSYFFSVQTIYWKCTHKKKCSETEFCIHHWIFGQQNFNLRQVFFHAFDL